MGDFSAARVADCDDTEVALAAVAGRSASDPLLKRWESGEGRNARLPSRTNLRRRPRNG